MDRLQGYCNACGQMATLPPHHALLSERVEECCQGGYQVRGGPGVGATGGRVMQVINHNREICQVTFSGF